MARGKGQKRRASFRLNSPNLTRLVVAVLLAVAIGLLVPGFSGQALSETTTVTEPLEVNPISLGSGPDSGTLKAASTVPILFPFLEHRDWVDTYSASHIGNDILAPKGTPLVAVVDGYLRGGFMNFEGTRLSRADNRPYFNVLLRGDDGNDYFYIHLNNDSPGPDGTWTNDDAGGPEHAYAPGLKDGSRVQKGQLLGWVGDSGWSNGISHLHFEIHIGGWASNGVNTINPYQSLKNAPTYDEWIVSGGGPVVPSTTTTTRPPTTTTTLPPTTTTTRVPGGQVEPGSPRFTDVYRSDWFYKDLALLCEAGAVRGSEDGLFQPEAEITRAQFTAFLARAFIPGQVSRLAAGAAKPTFSDVPSDHWGYAEIQAAAAAGLVKGVSLGQFDPDALITRAQMAVMVCRALDELAEEIVDAVSPGSNSFPDVPSKSHWAAREVELAVALGIITGCDDGTFKPERNASRAQAVAVLARALRVYRIGADS